MLTGVLRLLLGRVCGSDRLACVSIGLGLLLVVWLLLGWSWPLIPVVHVALSDSGQCGLGFVAGLACAATRLVYRCCFALATAGFGLAKGSSVETAWSLDW
ncbi:MAG: hypothetical protein R3F37_11785 [Candidatus Competibacteraceae bacterium]